MNDTQPLPDLVIRRATEADVPAIIALLANDPLGATRETPGEPLADCYRQAFQRMSAQGDNDTLVALDGGRIIGTTQLTIIHGLARSGMSRGQIEAVRVDDAYRGQGIGEALMRHAIEEARKAGCGLVQLTTDKSRSDAHGFYEKLGFKASHEGMKLIF